LEHHTPASPSHSADLKPFSLLQTRHIHTIRWLRKMAADAAEQVHQKHSAIGDADAIVERIAA
jgi:hypothetical protein